MRLIEAEIRDLKTKVLDMANLVQVQLENCNVALANLDYELAQKIQKKEKKVDKYDTKIDKRCERIIALYQPVANDLRFVFSVMKINSYLEQIGDSINGIARKIQEIKAPFDEAFLKELRLMEMFVHTKEILKDALTSYFKEDASLAKNVFPKDDVIDEIHRNGFKKIVEAIQKNPTYTYECIQLLLTIKNLEKVADFSVSIAEEAIFHSEGVVYRHTGLKYAYKQEEAASTDATSSSLLEN